MSDDDWLWPEITTVCLPGDHDDVDVSEVPAGAYRDVVCRLCGRHQTIPNPDTPLQDDLDDEEGDHRG